MVEKVTIGNATLYCGDCIEVLRKSMTIAEWEREIGVKPGIIRSRLNYGWTIDRAISEPVNFNERWHHE